MKSNYREIKNDLVQCPFNPTHKVKKCRLITHKKICPDKKNKGFVQCPYNPNHQVTIENFEKHKAKCPSRVVINSDLEKEMEEFIKNKTIEKLEINPVIKQEKLEKEDKEDKENIQNNYNEILGLNHQKKKKKKKNNNKKIKHEKKAEKQELKEIEEKAIDLETITNKELFNFIFNDNMVIEYHSDSSENIDDENFNEDVDKKSDEKSDD